MIKKETIKIEKDKGPIFIGGQMKSGTTMLRALLSQHKNIFGGLETHWFNIDINAQREDEKIKKLALFYEFDENQIDEIFQNYNQTNKHFIDVFLSYAARNKSKERWIEKTPQNIDNIELMQKNWESFYFIHVLRDFRDMYASWKGSGKCNVDAFVEIVKISYQNFDKYRSSKNYLEVKYEDIVVETEGCIDNILNFLNEDLDGNCYKINTNNSKVEFDKVRKITGKESNTLKSTQRPIFNTKIAQYKKILTIEEIDTIEQELGEFFYMFEYNI
jgi:protein-tyrosine sulfotransferase